MFYDAQNTIQVGKHRPIIFNSWRHYAIFKAIVELSKSGCDPKDFERVGKRGGELETQYTPAQVKKKKINWSSANGQGDATDVNNKLRGYIKTPQLAFFEPLVPREGEAIIDMSNYESEDAKEGDFVSGGTPITQFKKLPLE